MFPGLLFLVLKLTSAFFLTEQSQPRWNRHSKDAQLPTEGTLQKVYFKIIFFNHLIDQIRKKTFSKMCMTQSKIKSKNIIKHMPESHFLQQYSNSFQTISKGSFNPRTALTISAQASFPELSCSSRNSYSGGMNLIKKVQLFKSQQ